MRKLSKSKKRELNDVSKDCVDKSIHVGLLVAPLKIKCDLLILDDKLTFQLPENSKIKFTFGIYVVYNILGLQNVFQHINTLDGFLNTVLPCTSPNNLRPLYNQSGANLVLFSKTPGQHTPWINYIECEGNELILPMNVCKILITISYLLKNHYRFLH